MWSVCKIFLSDAADVKFVKQHFSYILLVTNFACSTGGGAIEMELSKLLRDYSRTIAGKEQLLIGAIAKALEVIPRQLCDNAGFDATNILNKLRQKHAQGNPVKCRFFRKLY